MCSLVQTGELAFVCQRMTPDVWKTISETYPQVPPRKIKSHLLLKKKEMDEAGGPTTPQLL